MNSWVRALVAEASCTRETMRATTESAAARCTRTVSAPVPLRVPANTSSPRCLRRGHRLAGDRGLVDLADPVQHLAVRADPLTGPDQHPVAHGQVGGGNDPLVVVGAQHGGLLRRQVQQGAHGVLGAAGDVRLERPGGGEDDDQQRAVEDLADPRGDEGGHDHQQVDVQRPLAQRLQPGQGRLPPTAWRSRRGRTSTTTTRGRRPAGARRRPGRAAPRRRPSGPPAGTPPASGGRGPRHGGGGRRRSRAAWTWTGWTARCCSSGSDARQP